MLAGGVAVQERLLYSSSSGATVQAKDVNSTVTATTDGFKLTRPSGDVAFAYILLNDSVSLRGFRFLSVTCRIANRDSFRYFELFLSSSATTPDGTYNRWGGQVYDMFPNMSTELSGGEWVTINFALNSVGNRNLSLAQENIIRSIGVKAERASPHTGPPLIEIKRIALTNPKPVFAMGIDDAFLTDHDVIYSALVESGANIPYYSAIPYRVIETGEGINGGFVTASGGDVMTVSQMLSMQDSGLWHFVNHTYQHVKLAAGDWNVASPVASHAPLNSVTEDGSLPVTYTNTGTPSNGGPIDAEVARVIAKEWNLCRDKLDTAGLNYDDSHLYAVSPFSYIAGDGLRVLKSEGYLGHRCAQAADIFKFSMPGDSPFNLMGVLANNTVHMDARIRGHIAKGGGMISPFHHAISATEKPRLVQHMREWQAMQDAGLCRFVSLMEMADMVKNLDNGYTIT